jgi:hypothetical protein
MNISRKQIPEMSLSEDKTVNLRSQAMDPHLMHEASDEEVENSHSRHVCREDQTAQCSAADAGNIAHSRRLPTEDQTAWRPAEAIKKSSHLPQATPAPVPAPDPVPVPAPALVPAPAPPIGGHVTRSQGKAFSEALTASAADPFTYAEDMESPQRNLSKRVIGEESMSILLNNTFSALNSQEARQLQVRPIGSKWVYKPKHNPDRSIQYKAWLVIKG